MCLFNYGFLRVLPNSGIVGSLGSFILSFFKVLSSIVAGSIYIPTSSARGFPLLHILSSTCCLYTFWWLPTTQEKTLHMDITRWSTPKSDWLYSLQPKMVAMVWQRVGHDWVTELNWTSVQNLLILIRSYLFICVFISIILGGGSWRILLWYISYSLLPIFYSVSFIVSGLTI